MFGRKTGIKCKENVKKDADKLDNVEDFWVSDSSSIEHEAHADNTAMSSGVSEEVLGDAGANAEENPEAHLGQAETHLEAHLGQAEAHLEAHLGQAEAEAVPCQSSVQPPNVTAELPSGSHNTLSASSESEPSDRSAQSQTATHEDDETLVPRSTRSSAAKRRQSEQGKRRSSVPGFGGFLGSDESPIAATGTPTFLHSGSGPLLSKTASATMHSMLPSVVSASPSIEPTKRLSFAEGGREALAYGPPSATPTRLGSPAGLTPRRSALRGSHSPVVAPKSSPIFIEPEPRKKPIKRPVPRTHACIRHRPNALRRKSAHDTRPARTSFMRPNTLARHSKRHGSAGSERGCLHACVAACRVRFPLPCSVAAR